MDKVNINLSLNKLKDFLPIIQALSEGKIIQVKNAGVWSDITDEVIEFDMPEPFYRIKPKPEGRPFNNYVECWNEMIKHEPFGWIKNKNTGFYYPVEKVDDLNDYVGIFEDYEFADGTPFGIIV